MTMHNENQRNTTKKAALISVFDKQNVVECARNLADMGYVILSTGGTYRTLVAHSIEAIPIEEYTGSAEFFDGRVKTLHPKIYAGILARRNSVQDISVLESEEIYSIDVVVVNLYPFEKIIRETSLTHYHAVENIDIGGVTLIRAAAKNHESVSVITDPSDYQSIIEILRSCSDEDVQSIHTLKMCNAHYAAKAFSHTAHYDAIIAHYMTSYAKSMQEAHVQEESKADRSQDIEIHEYTLPLKKIQALRYGENPHQNAEVYKISTALSKNSVIHAKQIHGKDLSFNNIRDAEAAVRIAHSFSDACVVAIKHGNPCGVGIDNSVMKAWKKCHASDTVSIFGGIVACNKPVDEMCAKQLSKIFLEIIIAPSFTADAKKILQQKKNLRILTMPFHTHKKALSNSKHCISIFGGGMLMQNYDEGHITKKQCACVTEKKATPSQMQDLLFAWNICKYVKSNAIVIAKNEATLGIGAGQMNRVGAASIAIDHVQNKNNGVTKLKGSVMASDAFFPMPDTVMLAAEHGIAAIIQPGGSIRDIDSIEACNAHGIAMVCTSMRHFLH